MICGWHVIVGNIAIKGNLEILGWAQMFFAYQYGVDTEQILAQRQIMSCILLIMIDQTLFLDVAYTSGAMGGSRPAVGVEKLVSPGTPSY